MTNCDILTNNRGKCTVGGSLTVNGKLHVVGKLTVNGDINIGPLGDLIVDGKVEF